MRKIIIEISPFVFLFYLFMLCACEPKEDSLPFFNSADLTPEWIEKKDPKYKEIHTIRDFSFTNQNNEIITNEDFKWKAFVANFFFTTCPSICPTMMDNMHLIQNEFIHETDLLLLSHTVTPWMDTVQQLKKYSIENDIDDQKWHLVTGDEEEIYNLARKSYFVDGTIGLQIDDDEFLHTENFLLIDKSLRIRGIYNGTIDVDVKRLTEDIKILLKES